jgi:hypothetical protein
MRKGAGTTVLPAVFPNRLGSQHLTWEKHAGHWRRSVGCSIVLNQGHHLKILGIIWRGFVFYVHRRKQNHGSSFSTHAHRSSLACKCTLQLVFNLSTGLPHCLRRHSLKFSHQLTPPTRTRPRTSRSCCDTPLLSRNTCTEARVYAFPGPNI